MKKIFLTAACAVFLSTAVFAEKGPVYISPNNDGVQDTLEVPLKIKEKRYVKDWSFVIKNQAGDVVRTIGNKEKREDKVTFKNFFKALFTPKKGVTIPTTLVWNGIMDNGQVAPDGTYYYEFTASDDNNNTATTKPLVVIVDNTPPEVNVAQLSGSDKIFGEGAKTVLTVRQSGSKEDEWLAEFTDAGGKVVRSYKMQDSEPVTLEWNGTNESGAPLPDGVYNYKIAATDRAGNKSAPAGINNLIYSAEKPATNIVINGSRYFSPVGTGSKSVLFDVKIPLPDPKSGNKLTNWAVTIIGADGKEYKKFEGTNNPPSSIEFDGTDDSGKLVSDGSYQAKVTAKYLNGYEPDVVKSPVFMLDTSKPVATLKTNGTVFSPDGDGNQDGMEITQTIMTNNGAPVNNWVGTVVDAKGNTVRTYNFGSYPPEKFSWDGLDGNSQMAADGEYTYKLAAVDAAGNAADYSTSKFSLDTSKAEIMLTTSALAFNPTGARNTIRFTPVMKASSAINHYKLSISDSAGKEVYSSEADGSLPNNFTWNGLASDGTRCADGKYVAFLETKAANGSEANAQTQAFAIDTVAPKIDLKAAYTLFSPDADSRKDTLPVEVVDCTDDNWTATIVNSKNAVVRTLTWNGKVPSFAWDATDDAGNKVPDGTYKLVFNAEDAAGNKSSAEIKSIVVDTRPANAFVTAEYEAFSPNGDNNRDTQQFTIRPSLNEGIETWKFDITSADGKVVRSWSNADSPNLPATITWDGLDSEKKVAEGVFTGNLDVVYAKGNEVKTVSSAFISSVTAPQLTVKTATETNSGYFSPDNDGTDDDLFIRLKAVTPVGLKNWSFTINDPNGRKFWATSGKSAITEQMTWDGRSNSGELVQSAMDYPYVFTATDNLGLTSTVEGKINIDILVIRVGDVLKMAVPSIIFRSDNADFKVESAPGKKDGVTKEQAANNERILNRIAVILNKFDTYKVTIVGHANRTTDNEEEETVDNPKMWGPALIPLSQRRAEFVKKYLVNHKVKADRLSTDGKGGREPVANPKDEANRWKNRRVEFILNK
ncbi:MAG: OmpA family protein [Treponema sp.]|nr:OmpA family protein [Treponema sp.]